jgi:hypothetical protein
MFVST